MLVRSNFPLSPPMQRIIDILDDEKVDLSESQSIGEGGVREIEQILISNPHVVHERHTKGSTLLHLVVGGWANDLRNISGMSDYWSYIEFYLIELLLSLDADVNAQDNLGNTALHIAARKRGGFINLLLKYNARILFNSSLETPLHIAAKEGNSQYILDCLVNKYPDSVDMQDGDGNTPLHLAFYEDCASFYMRHYSPAHVYNPVTLLLMKYQASDVISNNVGETVDDLIRGLPLSKEYVDVLKAGLPSDNKKIRSYLSSDYDKYYVKQCRESLIGGVVARGEIERLKHYLAVYPDVEHQRIIDTAARHNRIEILEYFLTMDDDCFTASADHYSPLLAALENNSIEAVKLIVEKNPTLLFKANSLYHSPLTVALAHCAISTVEFILEAMCRYDSTLTEKSALMALDSYDDYINFTHTLKSNNFESIKFLCEKKIFPLKGLKPNNPISYEDKIIDIFYDSNRVDILKYLIEVLGGTIRLSSHLYFCIARRPENYELLINKIDLLDYCNQRVIYDFSKKYKHFYIVSVMLASAIEARLEILGNELLQVGIEDQQINSSIISLIYLYTKVDLVSADKFLPLYFLRVGNVTESYKAHHRSYRSAVGATAFEYVNLSIAELFLTSIIIRADLPTPENEIEVQVWAAIGAFPYVFASQAVLTDRVIAGDPAVSAESMTDRGSSSCAYRMQNMTLYYLFGRAGNADLPSFSEPFVLSEQPEPLSLKTILLIQKYLKPVDFPHLAPVLSNIITHSLQRHAASAAMIKPGANVVTGVAEISADILHPQP